MIKQRIFPTMLGSVRVHLNAAEFLYLLERLPPHTHYSSNELSEFEVEKTFKLQPSLWFKVKPQQAMLENRWSILCLEPLELYGVYLFLLVFIPNIYVLYIHSFLPRSKHRHGHSRCDVHGSSQLQPGAVHQLRRHVRNGGRHWRRYRGGVGRVQRAGRARLLRPLRGTGHYLSLYG